MRGTALNRESPQEGTKAQRPQGLRAACFQTQRETGAAGAKPLEGEAWGVLSTRLSMDDSCDRFQVSGAER